MKNKYFGDINDFRKYGILRSLHEIKILVCWMLTEDDNRGDGNFLQYLQKGHKYRYLDEKLFDLLLSTVTAGERKVKLCEDFALIPNADYYSLYLTDNIRQREHYFRELYEITGKYDLIFLDPDNGLEVKSVKKGSIKSSKYLYYNEAAQLSSKGSSLLIYQHFPRIERNSYIKEISENLKRTTGAPEVFFLRTAGTVYFLVSREQHIAYFREKLKLIYAHWRNEIVCGPILLQEFN